MEIAKVMSKGLKALNPAMIVTFLFYFASF